MCEGNGAWCGSRLLQGPFSRNAAEQKDALCLGVAYSPVAREDGSVGSERGLYVPVVTHSTV